MKTIRILITNLLLLVLVRALHIQYHDTPQSYLSALKNQQSSLTSQVATMKTEASQVQGQVNAQSDLLNKIKMLQDSILRQKAQLATMSTLLITPLNDSSWTCQSYAKTTKQELISLAGSVATSSQLLTTAVNNISNQTSKSYFTPDSNSIQTMAQQIQKATYATSSSSNTDASTLTANSQNNWLVNSWVTGTNGTLADAQKQAAQNQVSTQSTSYTSICPLTAPFYNGVTCIACPSTAKYFNIQSKVCVSCDVFDPVTHVCQNNTPPVVTPPTNTTPVTPPTNTTPVTPPVVATPNGTNFQSGLNRVILPPTTTVDSLTAIKTQPCPSDKPFFSAGQCINCQSPNPLFNYSTSSCTTCPSGTTFIPEKHLCVGPKQVSVTNLPVSADRLILPDGTTVTTLQNQQQSIAAASSGSITLAPCPADKPFYNNQSCINCPTGQYFSVVDLTCQSCPSGSTYNVTSHKCIAITFYTNLKNNNWTSTNPASIQKSATDASTTVGATACPTDKPFYDGKQCVGCPDGSYFNFDGLKCQQCASGTVFSVNQHSCVKSQSGLYQTNPSIAPNLIFDGTSRGQWVTIYMQNQAKTPSPADCPTQRPYFDGITCINCPVQTPFFNLRYKVCQTCDVGSVYSETSHECLSSTGDIVSQKPNIEKMVASIFT